MNKYLKTLLLILSVAFVFVFTVPVSAADANLSNHKISLLPGETYRLSVKNHSGFVKWSSDTKKVARVSSKGKVRAIAPGKAVITATAGDRTYTCTLQVRCVVDVIVFCGQSNMTGVGSRASAPPLTQGAGYAFNYITDRKNFSPIKEPFGYKQNDDYFANGDYCRGSMVTAFANAYYKQTNTPIIAVPASCVGSGSVSWVDFRYKGVIQRVNAAVKLAEKKGLTIGHVYMVWMQGENDAFADMSASRHKKNLTGMVKKIMRKTPVEKCMVISIANYTKDPKIAKNFKRIQKAQKSLCNTNDNFILISTKATTLSEGSFREDGIHILQGGLNKIGTEAGRKAGRYAKSY